VRSKKYDQIQSNNVQNKFKPFFNKNDNCMHISLNNVHTLNILRYGDPTMQTKKFIRLSTQYMKCSEELAGTYTMIPIYDLHLILYIQMLIRLSYCFMPLLFFEGVLLPTSEAETIDDDDLAVVATFSELRIAESCCCLLRTTELPGCSRLCLLGEPSLATVLSLLIEYEELLKLLLLMVLLMVVVAVFGLDFSGIRLECMVLYDLGALLADVPLLSCSDDFSCGGGDRTK